MPEGQLFFKKNIWKHCCLIKVFRLKSFRQLRFITPGLSLELVKHVEYWALALQGNFLSDNNDLKIKIVYFSR